MADFIEGRTGAWEVVIGLEVHAQVISQAKLFSGAATAFGAEPNTQVSLVDAAFPGMLPVINRHCVEQAVKTGLGLDAEINLVSVFDRKNYFYADLPPGYQISQYSRPIVGKGEIALDMPDGSIRAIGITRLHLEQDAGKSLHDQHPTLTYVDLNRAGVALMEIVSEPDMRERRGGRGLSAQAALDPALSRHLRRQHGGGHPCAAMCNVSVRRPGGPLGTRCEIKNVNSIRFVMQAIEYEARRQIELIEEGGTDQAGDAAVRCRPRHDAADALQGGGARLPLFPRSRPAAARARCGLGRDAAARPAGAAGREEGALRRRLQAVARRCRRAGGGAGKRRLFRGRGQGARSQARRELGDRWSSSAR